MSGEPFRSSIFETITYCPFRPRIGRAKGKVLATRAGIVVGGGWLWRSLYHHGWVTIRAIAIAIASLLRRGVAPVAAMGPPVGLIHSLWSAGYYHWLTESLPRAYLLREAWPGVVPILPRGHYAAFAPSLAALGFDRIEWFPDGRNAIIDRPYLSECPPRFGTTDPALLNQVRRAVLDHFELPANGSAKQLVYVSRAQARGRRVANEAEVVAMLDKLGATIVCFEDLDFAGQVAMMDQTQLLVSIHGAGLTNMMWMRPGGAVIELLARRNGVFDWNVVRGSFLHDACYVRLAEAMGLRHRAVVGQAHNSRFSGTWNADLTVDVSCLLEAINELRA